MTPSSNRHARTWIVAAAAAEPFLAVFTAHERSNKHRTLSRASLMISGGAENIDFVPGCFWGCLLWLTWRSLSRFFQHPERATAATRGAEESRASVRM